MTSVIGKVALKVIPDTSSLRSETKDKVKEATDGLEIVLPAKVDSDRVKEEVKLSVKDINAVTESDPSYQVKLHVELDDVEALEDLRRKLAELRDKTVDVKLDFDKEGLQQFAQDVREIEDSPSIHKNIEVDYDQSKFDKLQQDMRGALEDIKVKIDPDESSYEKFKEELSKGINQSSKITPFLDEAKLVEIKRRLDSAFNVDLEPKVDKSKFFAELKGLESLDKFKNFKVGVSMDADLGKFREVTETKLKGFRFKVPAVDVNGNTRPLEAKLLELRRGVKDISVKFTSKGWDKIRAQLDALKVGTQVGILPVLNSRAMVDTAATLKTFASTLSKSAKVVINSKVKLDSAGFKTDLERMQAEAKMRSINLSVGLQEAGLHSQVAEFIAKTQLAFDLKKIKAKVKAEADKKSEVDTRAEMEAFFHSITAKIRATVDSKSLAAAWGVVSRMSGQRLHWKFTVDALDAVKNLDVMLPKIAALTTAFGNLSAIGGSSIGEIFGLTKSLAGILPGLAVAAPGVFLGMAAAATAAIVPLKNIAKQMPELKTMFTGLGDSMTNAFYGNARKGIDAFATDLVPRLTKGMSDLSAAEGSFAASLGGSLTKFVDPQILPFLESLAHAIQTSKGLADGFGKSLGALLAVGRSVLPQLIGYFSNLSEKLGNFLQASVKSGAAFNWISIAKSGLKDLGTAAWSLISIVGSVGKAANDAGLGGLHQFASALKDAANAMKDPQFQKGLADFFKSASEGVAGLVKGAIPGLKTLGATLADVATNSMPALGKAAGDLLGQVGKQLGGPAMRGSLNNFVKSVASAVETIKPYLNTLGLTFSAAIDVISNALKALAPILGRALDGIGPLLKGIVPDINAVVNSLSGALGGILDGLAPAIRSVVPALGSFLKQIGTGLGSSLKAITPNISGLASALADLLRTNLPKLGDLLSNHILPFVVELIKTYGPQIASLIKEVSRDLGPILKALGDIFDSEKKNIPGWAQGFGTVVAAIKGTFKVLGDFGNIWDDMAKHVNQGKFNIDADKLSKDLLDALLKIGYAAGMYMTLQMAFIGRDIILGIGEGIWRFSKYLWDKTKGLFDSFVKFVKDLLGIHSPSTVFAEIGGFVIQGLVKGLEDAAKAVWNWVTGFGTTFINMFKQAIGGLANIWGGITSGLSSAFGSATNVVTGLVQNIGSEISTGLTSAVSLAGTALSGLGSAISGAFSTVTSTVSSAMSTVTNFVEQGFDALPAWVQNSLSTLGTTVSNAFTTVSTGITNWFTTTATSISTGFTSFVTNAGTALATLWTSVSTAFTNVTTGVTGWFTSTGASILNGFLGLVTQAGTGIAGLWTTVSTAFTNVFTGITSWLASTGTSVLNGFVGFVTQAGSGLAGLWGKVSGILTTTLSGIGGWIASTAGSIYNGFLSFVGRAGSGLSGLWGGVVGIFNSVKSNIGGWITGAASFIGSGFRGFVNSAAGGLANLWGGISGAFSSAENSIAGWLSRVAGSMGSGAHQMVSAMESGLSSLEDTGSKAMDALWKGIQGSFGFLKDNFKWMIEGLGYVVDWFDALDSAASTLMSGLGNSIYKYSHYVSDALHWLTSMLPSWKGPYSVDKVLLTDAGKTIMQSLVDGINEGAVNVHKVLTDVTNDIHDSMAVKASADFTAVGRANGQAITSQALNGAPVASDGTSTGGANVNVSVVNPDPYVAARIAADQLKFALGA